MRFVVILSMCALVSISSAYAGHKMADVQLNFLEPLEWKVEHWADAPILTGGGPAGPNVITVDSNRGKTKGRYEDTDKNKDKDKERDKSITYDDSRKREKVVGSGTLEGSDRLFTAQADPKTGVVSEMTMGPKVGEGPVVANPMFKDSSGNVSPLTKKIMGDVATGRTSGWVWDGGAWKKYGGPSSGPGT